MNNHIGCSSKNSYHKSSCSSVKRGIVTLNFITRLPANPCLLMKPLYLTMCLVSFVVIWPCLFIVTSWPSKCWKVLVKPKRDYQREISSKQTKLLPSLDQLLRATSITVIQKSDGAPWAGYQPTFRIVKTFPLGSPFGIGIQIIYSTGINFWPLHLSQVFITVFPEPRQVGHKL